MLLHGITLLLIGGINESVTVASFGEERLVAIGGASILELLKLVGVGRIIRYFFSFLAPDKISGR